MAPNYKISDIRVPTTAHRQAMAVALFFFVCTTFYLSIPVLWFLRVAFELTVCVYEASTSTSTLPRKVLLIHGALTMVLPYVHTRLRRHALSKAWPDAPSSDRRRRAWELMTKLETTHSAVALASFIVFLWDGQ